MEVFPSNVASLGTSSTIEDDAKNAGIRVSATTRRKKGNAYIKPMIAITLINAIQNSASPYPFTPKRLIAMITTKKMVTQTAGETGEFQY